MLLNSDLFLKSYQDAQRIYIGYSGGIDSHVLLHWCASLTHLKNKIIAVYVHHGLQVAADSWAEHCQYTAQALDVRFKSIRVNATARRGESPEEAARNARYQALQSLLSRGDVLMIAQHQEDQLETVLLQLFRGSGLKGLSGMPEMIAFGQGLLARPLLNVSKQLINDYALTHDLKWIEDPSNQSNVYDRNYLRNEILPLLKQRWPMVAKTVARSASHCADAQRLVNVHGEGLFSQVYNPVNSTLNISKLQAFGYNEQVLIIRHWFGAMGLKMPSQSFLGQLFIQVLAAREDSDPVLLGQAHEWRRYRNELYCLPCRLEESLEEILWDSRQESVMIGHRLRLSWSIASTGIPLTQWQQASITIKYRRGGEKISLPKRQGRHDLKKLFQEADIPPWQRNTLPLIYLDNQLAAIGDYWVSADFYTEEKDACVRLQLSAV